MSQPPSYPGPGDSQANDPSGRTPGGGHDSSGQPAGSQPPGSPAPGSQNYGAPNYGSQNNGGQGYGAQPPANQYGAWQGGNDASQKNSGVALAALIAGFACCFGWVGIILGIIGIRQTGPGKAKGRWMAVTGIVVGTAMTLAFAGLGLAIFVFAKDNITPDNAKAGECMNVDKDDDNVRMTRKDCSEDHDAQIFEVGSLSYEDAEALRDRRFADVQICQTGAKNVDGEALTGELGGTPIRLGVPVVNDNKNFDDGDKVICYIEATSGKLNGDYVKD